MVAEQEHVRIETKIEKVYVHHDGSRGYVIVHVPESLFKKLDEISLNIFRRMYNTGNNNFLVPYLTSKNLEGKKVMIDIYERYLNDQRDFYYEFTQAGRYV
jgi:hypothetical protein